MPPLHDAAADAPQHEEDHDYGYGEACPDHRHHREEHTQQQRSPKKKEQQKSNRRSSLKSSSCHEASNSRRKSLEYRGEIEVSVPTGGKIRRRVSVGFGAGDSLEQVKEVTPLSELTDGKRIWFQSDDFAAMKQKAFRLVDAVQEGRLAKEFPKRNYCTRGLEQYLHDEEYQKRKYSAIDAVMDEQDLQFDKGTFNEESVAEAYGKSSEQSKLYAEQLAARDAADIQAYTNDIRRMMRRLSV